MNDKVRSLTRATLWWSATTALLGALTVVARVLDLDVAWSVPIVVIVLAAVVTTALAVSLWLTPLPPHDEE